MCRLTGAGVVLALVVCTASRAVSLQHDVDVPLWTDAAGRPTPDARAALALLRNAADEGLDPADYDLTTLESLAGALEPPRLASRHGVARLDAALSDAMVRYLRHLHEGRVDPRAAGFRMTVPADDHDFAAILRAAIAGDRLVETVAEFTDRKSVV